MHGGVKFYRGSAAAARSYVEVDRSRADDYYLAEGTGLADRYIASPHQSGDKGAESRGAVVRAAGSMDGPTYERWVGGYNVDTGHTKGRLRDDKQALRFVEVVINGPKTWSLAAALHPEIAAAYDTAQDQAAAEIIGWLAEHATTRVGPRGRQVQVTVEQIEAAVVRHYTSRAGDPHRHLHLQINARVFAAGAWRGLHSVGVVDSINALNGIGHAAVACHPAFRQALNAHGYTLDPASGEITHLAPHTGAFSARAAQISRNIDRYEANWRHDHPDQEPSANLRQTWDRRAWSEARPDKVVPTDGTQLAHRWVEELHDLGFTPPTPPTSPPTSPPSSPPAAGSPPSVGVPLGRLDRDAIAESVIDLVLSRLGSRRSAWNAADIRGEIEHVITSLDIVAPADQRQALAKQLTARTVEKCVPLLRRRDVPDHVRALTSERVLAVEDDLVARLTRRADLVRGRSRMDDLVEDLVAQLDLDLAQRQVVAALAGTSPLLVVEGAAGAGKTTTLAAAQTLLAAQRHRLVVVTPTLKAARVAQGQVGADAFSAAWLIHQHGYRWDEDGHWTRTRPDPTDITPAARLRAGDVVLVDEAGMVDQDTARALLTIADETGARVALVGDRHQLPAVGRGGLLDHAARWTHPDSCLALETVHRFTDLAYADLTLHMRTGHDPAAVFDALVARGQITIHATDVERTAAIADRSGPDSVGSAAGGRRGLVIADTREQVTALNAAIRDQHHAPTVAEGTGVTGGNAAGETEWGALTTGLITAAGELLSVGDRVATRRNDHDLGVANRDTWIITATHPDGTLHLNGAAGSRVLPAAYARQYVELAYATTVHGAQGTTVDHADVLIGQTTGAAATYVAMTRGRNRNTAHLVADTIEDARAQWIEVFNRDRADLGPAHAATRATDDIDRYGPGLLQAAALQHRNKGPSRGQRPRIPPHHFPHYPGDASGMSL
jgi:exodeoxyribonuclease V alpha subunit